MIGLGQIVERLKRFRLLAIIAVLRWAIALGGVAFGLAYIAYKEHSSISTELTTDFGDLAKEQQELVQHLSTLMPSLLDPNISVAVETELDRTRTLAQSVVVSLAQFRAPTRRIDKARFEYRQSLEGLIGMTHRIKRSGVDGVAVDLHNSVQMAANKAGHFRASVEDFQGGAWPQVVGSFF